MVERCVQVSFMCGMAPCQPHIMEDMPMHKTITAVVAVASIATAVIATPKPAEARCIGCWVGAGIAAGIIGGAIASSAYGGYGYGGYGYGGVGVGFGTSYGHAYAPAFSYGYMPS